MVNFRLGNTPAPDLLAPNLPPLDLGSQFSRIKKDGENNRRFSLIPKDGGIINRVDPSLVASKYLIDTWNGSSINLNLEDQLVANGQVLPENRNVYQIKETNQSIHRLTDEATRVVIVDNKKDSGGTTERRKGISLAFIGGANSSGIFDGSLLLEKAHGKVDESQISGLPFTDFFGLQKDKQGNYFAPSIADVSSEQAMKVAKESTDVQLTQAIKNADNNEHLKLVAASAAFVPMMRSLITKIKNNEIPKDLKVSLIGADPFLGLSDFNRFMVSSGIAQQTNKIGPDELKKLDLENPVKRQAYVNELLENSSETKGGQPNIPQKVAANSLGMNWQVEGVGSKSMTPDLLLSVHQEFETLIEEIKSLTPKQKAQLNVTVIKAGKNSEMDSGNYKKLHDALPQMNLQIVDSTHNIALVNPEELAKIVGETN